MSPGEFREWMRSPGRRPLVMGVLNATPDSFSDGGLWTDPLRAGEAAAQMVADGADLIDIGGESTRPGSRPVPEAQQLERVLPVIHAVIGSVPSLALSVDTTRAVVAQAALDAGVTLVNDISAGRDDPALLPMVARRNTPIVLMHMQGTPATMHLAPVYRDVVDDVVSFLQTRIAAAVAVGVDQADILVDPGFGFGKTVDHNLLLLREIATIASLGRPVVLGTSRKGFIGKVLNEPDPGLRTHGTSATVSYGISAGAAIVRVHDVHSAAQVVLMTRAIAAGMIPPLPEPAPAQVAVP